MSPCGTEAYSQASTKEVSSWEWRKLKVDANSKEAIELYLEVTL